MQLQHTPDDPDRPIFMQINNEAGLRWFERQSFDRPANCYTRKRDSAGQYLLRVGFDDGAGRYSGHLYIIRCNSRALSGSAEALLRKKLGLPDRGAIEPNSRPLGARSQGEN